MQLSGKQSAHMQNQNSCKIKEVCEPKFICIAYFKFLGLAFDAVNVVYNDYNSL